MEILAPNSWQDLTPSSPILGESPLLLLELRASTTHLPRGKEPHRQPGPGARVLGAAFLLLRRLGRAGTAREAARSGNEAHRCPVGAERAGGKLNAPPWEVQRYLFLVFISLRLSSFFFFKSHQFNNNPKIGKLRERGRGAWARDTGGPAPGPSLLQGTPFRPHYCCCWAVGVGWGWAAIVLPQLTWGQNLPLLWGCAQLLHAPGDGS